MLHTDLVPKPQLKFCSWPQSITIEVIQGPDQGRRFELALRAEGKSTDRFVGGRGNSCDIQLTDTSVSEVHFSLNFASGLVRLTDEQSRNGTWCGHGRLDPGSSVQLLQGAEFRACNTLLRLSSVQHQQLRVSQAETFGAVRGRSDAMMALFAQLEQLAPTPLSVLIMGETGVGKGVVARAIHDASKQAESIFHRLDCATLPRELAEATLFGHAAGAFTGALGDRAGVFEVADGGTLFLDEIGELPPDHQLKFLTALDEHVVTRVGETMPRRFDVRIIVATNRDLREDVEQGRFRRDLYHRLAEVEFTIPALRHRPQDILCLAEHFVEDVATEAGRQRSLSDEAKEALQKQLWPGNARELRRVIKQAVYLSQGEKISAHDLPLFDDRRVMPPGTNGRPDVASPDISLSLKQIQADLAVHYCQSLMAEVDNNIDQAARSAGYGVKGFQALLRRLELHDLLGQG